MKLFVPVLSLLAALVAAGCSNETPPVDGTPPVKEQASPPAAPTSPKGHKEAPPAAAPVAAVEPAPVVEASAVEENPLLKELVEKGLTMPDGSVMKLSPPMLTSQMDAAARKAAIKKIIPLNCTWEDFIARDAHAPMGVKITTVRNKKAGHTFRTVDVGFVAYGKWKTLKSEKFSDSLLRRDPKAKQSEAGEAAAKFGALTDAEMAKRGLKPSAAKALQERYIYSTFSLLDLVQINATRYGVLTDVPGRIVLAARIDPRFAKDAEYPNQWRPIDKDALGQKVLGEAHPYQGAGFYIKATSLGDPPQAIFFEFHSLYNEPQGWFEDEPERLRRKLPSIAQFKIQQFRERLARFDPAKESNAAKPAEK